MNRQNIISAGKMMAIVVALLGAMFCGAALAPVLGGGGDLNALSNPTTSGGEWLFGIAPLYNILFGVTLIVCGLVLTSTFGLAERRPVLATLILVFGTLTALLGILAVAFVYRNPFSWMTGIVGLAIFIDALCLGISLSSSRNS